MVLRADDLQRFGTYNCARQHTDALPPARLARRAVDRFTDPGVGELAPLFEARTGVIVAGAGIDEPDAVVGLAVATGWVVVADPRSGCRGLPGVVTAGDALLRVSQVSACRPDVVVHLGEPPASKVLARASSRLRDHSRGWVWFWVWLAHPAWLPAGVTEPDDAVPCYVAALTVDPQLARPDALPLRVLLHLFERHDAVRLLAAG